MPIVFNGLAPAPFVMPPVATCRSRTNRLEDNLVIEKWTPYGGLVLVRVPRRVNADTLEARREFDDAVLRPLLKAKPSVGDCGHHGLFAAGVPDSVPICGDNRERRQCSVQPRCMTRAVGADLPYEQVPKHCFRMSFYKRQVWLQ